MDVSVRHALTPSHPTTEQSRERWHEKKERDKVTKRNDVCSRFGLSFVLLILDRFGGIGDDSRTFFRHTPY